MHGIPLAADIFDIEKEKKVPDKFLDKKTDTESVIIAYNSQNVLPSYLYLGLTVIKCQRFGHISKNRRGKQKCPFCGENHSFDECQNRDNKKCSSCGGSHSAGFKDCPVFVGKHKKSRNLVIKRK